MNLQPSCPFNHWRITGPWLGGAVLSTLLPEGWIGGSVLALALLWPLIHYFIFD